MSILVFMGDHPVLSLWMTLVVAIALVEVFNILIWPINQWIRHQNIKAAGWPPEHLDVDGDFKPRPEVEDPEVPE